ncbi:MAG: RsfS/YbeB/iojap family protein, partial [Lachnospiraceae bacterium]|nr:RsfS/YbeB/iojap family protein [Lachnospiraceae bacterium]
MTDVSSIQTLVGKAILALEDKKAEDIRVIDISKVS